MLEGGKEGRKRKRRQMVMRILIRPVEGNGKPVACLGKLVRSWESSSSAEQGAYSRKLACSTELS